jgi:hypothetical protein
MFRQWFERKVPAYLDRTIKMYILNLALVDGGGRPATLVDEFNPRVVKGLWKRLDPMIQRLSLHKTLDPLSVPNFPRYLISKERPKPWSTDPELGALLGMDYLRPDYGNARKPRISAYIQDTTSGVEFFVEVMRPDKMDAALWKRKIRAKLQRWERILIKAGLDVKLRVQFGHDDGMDMRTQRLRARDVRYFKKHLYDYRNDLYNEVSDAEEHKVVRSRFSKTPSTFTYSETMEWVADRYADLYI